MLEIIPILGILTFCFHLGIELLRVFLAIRAIPFEKKMQLDIDIEPTLRFPGIKSILNQMDHSESKVGSHPPAWDFYHRQTDRRRCIRVHRATCIGGLNKGVGRQKKYGRGRAAPEI